MLHANPIHFSIEEPSIVSFSVEDPRALSFSVEESSDKPVSFEVDGKLIAEYNDTEPYDGNYVITPSFESQSFDTTNKRMTQMFTVNPISINRITNLAGGKTVFIGEI